MKYQKLALATAAMALVGSGSAQAAVTGTVTGDDGNPVALSASAPLNLRNMDVKAVSRVQAGDAGSFQAVVLDPAGVPAESGTTFCWNTKYTNEDNHFVDYRGNGTYTLRISLFSDTACKTPKSTVNLRWTVAASVAIVQPPGPLFTRALNSFSTNTQQLDFVQNPGATTYEIKFAKGGVVQADGSISSPAIKDGFLNRATGKIEIIGASEPGDYVVVARAKSGDYYTAWSPPVTMRLIAPFDFSSRRFPDSRGPRYSVRGVVREPSAAGSRVTIAVAKGKKGKRFRTLGKPKINSKGVFKLKFTIRKRGTYRLRYSFRGNATVARGAIYEVIKIRRVIR
ncbi:MAG TPA: hypothetical protein VFZ00_20725 [Solirubrobacter sp.]|nr:hypothetical protein [Solirubrobacter sp.]